MKHYCGLVIMPKEKIKDVFALTEVNIALNSMLEKYLASTKVESYIALPYIELWKKYNEFNKEHPDKKTSLDDFAIKWCGFDALDRDMNAISTANHLLGIETYEIGGHYRGTLINFLGNYVDVSKISLIDWELTINKASFRAKRDWKLAKKESEKMSKIIYKIDKDTIEKDYINDCMYNSIETVIDRNGDLHQLNIKNKEQWNEEFFDKFIKTSKDEDIIILIDYVL